MGSIGICYGRLADNLPSSEQVVAFYLQHKISSMRIYNGKDHEDVLEALRGTKIRLIMDAPMGSYLLDFGEVKKWVEKYIVPYHDVKFKYIAVGNEVEDSYFVSKILPAMMNMRKALSEFKLQDKIKVSTAVKSNVLKNTYPPSNGEFRDAHMKKIVKFLSETGAPLLANIYPFFSCIAEPGNSDLHDYALFQPRQPVIDEASGRKYLNLFDAMVDSVYYALEKAGGSNVNVVVSETGWPSDCCGNLATVKNAEIYNQNLVRHIVRGPKESTPKWLEKGALEVYIFAMFNENLKTGAELEKHFGLFKPDQTPVYSIKFS